MNRFTFTSMNYPIDEILDSVLAGNIISGIESITTSRFDLDIVFKNGSFLHGWNGNRYYAWLSQGYIKFFKSKESYYWHDKRPSRKTMSNLLDLIKAYYLNKEAKKEQTK